MKRRLITLCILALLSLTALLAVGWAVLPGRARSLLASSSQEALGVPATIAEGDLAYADSILTLAITGLDIQNPPGFDGAPLLHLGEVQCALQPTTVLDDTVVFQSLSIHDLRLRIVQKGKESNLEPLLRKVASAISRPGPEPPPVTTTIPDHSKGPRIDLQRIDIAGWGIDLDISGLGPLDIRKSATLPAFSIPLNQVRASDGGAPTLSDLLSALLVACHDRALAESEPFLPEGTAALLRGGSFKEQVKALGGTLIEDELDRQIDRQLDRQLNRLLDGSLDSVLPGAGTRDSDQSLKGTLKNSLGERAKGLFDRD